MPIPSHPIQSSSWDVGSTSLPAVSAPHRAATAGFNIQDDAFDWLAPTHKAKKKEEVLEWEDTCRSSDSPLRKSQTAHTQLPIPNLIDSGDF